MKKIFLGLLLVPGFAFGMEQKKQSEVIAATDRCQTARAEEKNIARDTNCTCCVGAGLLLLGTSDLMIQNGRSIPFLAAGCCASLASMGMSRYYSSQTQAARTSLATAIRAKASISEIEAFESSQNTWIVADADIKEAINDRKFMLVLAKTSSAEMK